MSEGPLAGVRVVDLTDERAIYGAKLMADLGASVLRPEPPGGDPLRARGPLTAAGTSLWHAFFATGRAQLTVDPAVPAACRSLQQLVEAADIVLTTGQAGLAAAVDLVGARQRRAGLIHIDCSSFGDDGPWRDLLAPDLVAGALGGAVATTGAPDTPPLKTFGDLNFMVSGVYVAIAALAALFHQRSGGAGQRVSVPVHGAIASCLEQVFMLAFYGELMGRGKVLPRQAGTHWSMLYTVMPAQAGAIMVTPAPDIEAQLMWLIEEDAHQDLLDPMYSDPVNQPLLAVRLMQVLREWVAGQDAEALFHRAQARHAPYGWVQPLERLAENPQLAARDWWVATEIDGKPVRAPGVPYRFSATPAQPRPPRDLGTAAEAARLLAELGWDSVRPTPAGGRTATRPLDGLRILDFTHVLAGPFATRVLGDMGADVVKVNSAERAQAANSPESPYYTMWNRNKRALSLDMKSPEAKALCQRIVENVDVVIDNFAVGVLDRWGVGFSQVKERNPGVIYIQMSGMGEGGPWSGFVTYAPTIHAICGLTSLTSVPGREDIGIGHSYNDHQAGLHGAVAILAALEARRRTGRGQRIDLSQFEVGVHFLGPALLDWFVNGRAARPVANRVPYDAVAPHNVYPCLPKGDGLAGERWVAIVCETDAQWAALAELLGRPAWATDPALASAAGRVAAVERLDAGLAAWTRDQRAETVMARCQAAGVPAGVVQDGADLEQDPQLRHQQFVREVAGVHPVLGAMRIEGLPIHFAATPCEQYERVHWLGEDNVAVLGDWLGLPEEEVRRLEATGVLR